MEKLTVSSGLGRVKTAVVSANIILLEPLPYRHPQAYHPRTDDGGWQEVDGNLRILCLVYKKPQ